MKPCYNKMIVQLTYPTAARRSGYPGVQEGQIYSHNVYVCGCLCGCGGGGGGSVCVYVCARALRIVSTDALKIL